MKLTELPGITAKVERVFLNHNVKVVRDLSNLLSLGDGVLEEISNELKKLKISRAFIFKLVTQATLVTEIKGLSTMGLYTLEVSGIDSISALASSSSRDIHSSALDKKTRGELDNVRRLIPESQIQGWIDSANMILNQSELEE